MTILGSSAIAAGDLLAISPNAVVSAMDGVPEISVSFESAMHMNDVPQQIATPGSPPVVAAPTISVYQTGGIALRCLMNATWQRRDDRCIAWLTATKLVI